MHHPTSFWLPTLTTSKDVTSYGAVTNYGGTVPAITRSLMKHWMVANLPVFSFVDAAASANARHIAFLASAGTIGCYYYNDAFTDNREAFQITGTSAAISLFRIQVAQLVLGHTAAVTVGNSGKLQVMGNSAATSQAQISRFSSTESEAPTLALSKSASNTVGTNTIVGANTILGRIDGYGATGSAYALAAFINFFVDGTPGSGTDMPGGIGFATSPDGTATPVEGLRIDNTQTLRTGTTARNANSGSKIQTVAGVQTTNSASVGGTIYSSITPVGNTAATETDAFAHTMVANTLNTNRDSLEIIAAGTFSATASVDKQIKIKLGATTIFDSGALPIITNVAWHLRCSLVRKDVGNERVITTLLTGDPAQAPIVSFTSPTEGLNGNLGVKLTLTATNANDVVAEFYKETWSAAA